MGTRREEVAPEARQLEVLDAEGMHSVDREVDAPICRTRSVRGCHDLAIARTGTLTLYQSEPR
jgi:hypothetical protein